MSGFESKNFSYENFYTKEQRIHRYLIERALYSRAASEKRWSKGTVQPGDFDETNPSAGQCAPTIANYLPTLSTKKEKAEIRRATDGEAAFHEGNILQGAVISFQFGDMLSYDGTLVTDDHCWGLIEYPEDDISFDVDLTPDQFWCAGFTLPPVMVQRTGEYDGQPVIHIARKSIPMNEIDHIFDPPKHGDRQGILSFKLSIVTEHDMSQEYNGMQHAPRIKEMSSQCFPGMNITGKGINYK